MKYSPTYRPVFLEERDFETEYPLLEQEISPYAHRGRLASFDGGELEYEYYLAQNATASVVIVHGLSEFIGKYRELCKFLLDMGFNVFIYDQRGHGLSHRETEDLHRAHVGSFDSYVKDLECIIHQLVAKEGDLPLYLFSHSMGGAVTGLYMQKHPERVKKSVMCAPMIAPNMNGYPRLFMRWVLSRDAKKTSADAPFRAAKKFNPNPNFLDSSDQSAGRFRVNIKMRLADKHYQNSEISNQWLIEATKIQNRLCNRKSKKITADILIINAQKDGVVLENPQRKFFKYLQKGKWVSVENAKHNIFSGNDEVLQNFYRELEDFLQ